MKRINRWLRIGLFVFCLVTALILVSCADMDLSNNDELTEEFMTHVMNDDADAAYEMAKNTVSRAEFLTFWAQLQTVVAGAEDYDIEQTGWNVNTSDGVTTYTTAYQIEFDNDRTVQLQMVTCDDIEGIAGVHFTDVTDFEEKAERTLPVIRVVMGLVSLAALAFTVWMFVDCLRRKLKYKALWAILVFVGVAWTVTVGEEFGLRFMVGLMLQTSSITADVSRMAYVVKLVVPVGAIIYLCLRKRFTVLPEEPTEEQNTIETQAKTEPTESSETTAPAESTDAEPNREENGEEPKN